jgi:hypothetical protein
LLERFPFETRFTCGIAEFLLYFPSTKIGKITTNLMRPWYFSRALRKTPDFEAQALVRDSQHQLLSKFSDQNLAMEMNRGKRSGSLSLGSQLTGSTTFSMRFSSPTADTSRWER